MNNIQQEQLFTDLIPTQAETIAAGVFTKVDASYGYAEADVIRFGTNSFAAHLKVGNKGTSKVYAKFQAEAADGTTLTTSTKRYDVAQNSFLTDYFDKVVGSFNKNINQVRVAIYKDQTGTDPVAFGNWIKL
ncbi:MAG TPA: hypothetical protein V6C57_15580 [Coleofasciculaceae cyanobacterium]